VCREEPGRDEHEPDRDEHNACRDRDQRAQRGHAEHSEEDTSFVHRTAERRRADAADGVRQEHQ
jgi:hypothetical protein